MVTFLSMIENEVVQSKLEQAYYLYRKQLIALAYDILKDRHEAEDIVQNAFIRFSDYIDENIDIECHKTRGFIVIIVRGLAFNLYNQRKRRATVNIDELENVIAGKEDGMPEIRALRIDKSA
jgi:RNA polymerase sigma-70 factor, ECF subfamily